MASRVSNGNTWGGSTCLSFGIAFGTVKLLLNFGTEMLNYGLTCAFDRPAQARQILVVARIRMMSKPRSGLKRSPTLRRAGLLRGGCSEGYPARTTCDCGIKTTSEVCDSSTFGRETSLFWVFLGGISRFQSRGWFDVAFRDVARPGGVDIS